MDGWKGREMVRLNKMNTNQGHLDIEWRLIYYQDSLSTIEQLTLAGLHMQCEQSTSRVWPRP